MSFDSYYNELYRDVGRVRSHYQPLAEWIAETPTEHIVKMRQAAHLLFHRVGITFAVYGEEAGSERLIPFDMLPHIIRAAEWRAIAKGLRQRAKALNAFLHDIYHGQEILRAGHIPKERVTENKQFRPEMVGLDVPGGIYAHVAGIDLVRAGAGEYYVLEDNLRTPSGVSDCPPARSTDRKSTRLNSSHQIISYAVFCLKKKKKKKTKHIVHRRWAALM